MLTLPIYSADLWTTNNRLRTKKKEAWDYKKTHLDTIDQLDTICVIVVNISPTTLHLINPSNPSH